MVTLEQLGLLDLPGHLDLQDNKVSQVNKALQEQQVSLAHQETQVPESLVHLALLVRLDPRDHQDQMLYFLELMSVLTTMVNVSKDALTPMIATTVCAMMVIKSQMIILDFSNVQETAEGTT